MEAVDLNWISNHTLVYISNIHLFHSHRNCHAQPDQS